MAKKSIRFVILMFVILIVVFTIHNSILNYYQIPLFSNYILLSYLLNFILAIAVLILMEKAIKKKSTHSGMFFITGSALKYLVFFIVLYPLYIKDGSVTKTEFASFFVPYGICLLLEVIYLSKKLNSL